MGDYTKPLTPRTKDGKAIFLPQVFPDNVTPHWSGQGDDIAAGTVGGGQGFYISSTVQEDKTIEWQYKDFIYIAGGTGYFQGAITGDYVDFLIYAPASTTYADGTKDYNKVEIIPSSGLHRIDYVGGGTGDTRLDLTEAVDPDSPNVTKVTPVPNETQEGHFDWDPDTYTVSANVTQTGKYDLFDFDVNLAMYGSHINILGDGVLHQVVSSVHPKMLLPQWKYKMTLHNSTAKNLDVAVTLWIGREKTI